jgi:hypothetical protein
MNPIPGKLKQKMNEDEYYKVCCLSGRKNCVINWHHTYTYSGKQINEEWCIMPIWEELHNWAFSKLAVHNNKETMEFVKYLSLLRANISDLIKRMPKKNWMQEFKVLEKRFKDKKEDMLKIYQNQNV